MKALRALHSAFLIFLLLAPILIIWSLVIGLGFYVFSDGLETTLWIDRRETALWICGIALVASIVLAPIAMKVFSHPVTRPSSFAHSSLNTIASQTSTRKLSGTDQRRHPRYSINCAATFSNEQLNGLGMIGDVSSKGCRLTSQHQMTPGDSWKLLIDVPGLAAPLQIATGVVRWATGSDCGIEFMTIGAEEQRFSQWIMTLAKRIELTDLKRMAAS